MIDLKPKIIKKLYRIILKCANNKLLITRQK